jgi:hypothetical protein
MGRIGVYLNDEIEKRLKDYSYKKTGSFRGLSTIAAIAIEEYLIKHEKEVGESQGNCEVSRALAQ